MKTAIYLVLPISIVSAIFAIPAFKSHARIRAAIQDPARATTPATQPAASVKIENFIFDPKELNIPVGTAVTWKNSDDVPHTVTSKDDSQLFDSGAIDTDDKFSFTFSKPGTYAYYCKVHPHMTGVVIVK